MVGIGIEPEYFVNCPPRTKLQYTDFWITAYSSQDFRNSLTLFTDKFRNDNLLVTHPLGENFGMDINAFAFFFAYHVADTILEAEFIWRDL